MLYYAFLRTAARRAAAVALQARAVADERELAALRARVAAVAFRDRLARLGGDDLALDGAAGRGWCAGDRADRFRDAGRVGIRRPGVRRKSRGDEVDLSAVFLADVVGFGTHRIERL